MGQWKSFVAEEAHRLQRTESPRKSHKHDKDKGSKHDQKSSVVKDSASCDFIGHRSYLQKGEGESYASSKHSDGRSRNEHKHETLSPSSQQLVKDSSRREEKYQHTKGQDPGSKHSVTLSERLI